MAKRKSKEFLKRSNAAKRGWLTRRKKNPQRWGKRAVAEKKKERERLKTENRKLRAIVKKLKRKLMAKPPKKKKPTTVERAITELKEMGQGPEKWYHNLAEEFNLLPREVFTLWVSPDVA